MILFDTLKKLFNNSANDASQKGQSVFEKYHATPEISFSEETPTDGFSPYVVPLNARLKKAIPSRNGLYPHEILMLDYAHTYSTDLKNQNFQGFWYYEYSVEHPDEILKSLKKRGFVQIGDIKSAIQHLTIPALKETLKAIGQKVTGKKADLVNRLLANASHEELDKKFPIRFFALTRLGQQELAENQYVPYLHRHKYMSIWEMNDRLYRENPKHLGYRDIIWQFFNEESLKHLERGDFSLYCCTRADMFTFLLEEKKFERALFLLCEVIAYDLSGMMNNEFRNTDARSRLRVILQYAFPYEKSEVKLSSHRKRQLIILQELLNLSDENFYEQIQQQFLHIRLYRQIFTNPECVDIIIAELHDDTDTLNAIYLQAEKRIRAILKITKKI